MVNTIILKVAEYYNLTTNSTKTNSEEIDRNRKLVEVAQEEAKKRGSKVSPNSKVIKNYKAALPSVLPFSVFCVVLGNMLGDCTIKYNPSKDEACLAFEWGNKEYAYFIYHLLYDYVLSPPRVQVRTNASGNEVTTYCFQTVTIPAFAIINHIFIDNNVKTIPVGLITYLVTPLTLAIWFMDDGGQTDYRSGHGRGIQLNTQGFTVEAVTQAVQEMNEKFDLNCWIRLIKHRIYQPIIVIPSYSYTKFRNLIIPYMHDSMMYKLPELV